MSKRKTRQEKIIAELRRKLQITPSISSPHSISLPTQLTREMYVIPSQKKSLAVYEKSYIMGDLQKTTILTLSILVFEIVLYILLQRHIISLATLRF